MKKRLILFVGLMMFMQTPVFAAEGAATVPSARKTGQQKTKAVGKHHFEGPQRVTTKDKLSTSGHRNDREGTEDADMPLPDGVKRNKLQPSAGKMLNDTPRNPVQGR